MKTEKYKAAANYYSQFHVRKSERGNSQQVLRGEAAIVSLLSVIPRHPPFTAELFTAMVNFADAAVVSVSPRKIKKITWL